MADYSGVGTCSFIVCFRINYFFVKGKITSNSCPSARMTKILRLSIHNIYIQYIIYVRFCCGLKLCWHKVNLLQSSMVYLPPLLYSLYRRRLNGISRHNSTNRTVSPAAFCCLSSLVILPILNDHDLLSFCSRSCCKHEFGAYYFLKHVPTLKWLVCAKCAVERGDSRLCVRGEMAGERCGKTAKVLAAKY